MHAWAEYQLLNTLRSVVEMQRLYEQQQQQQQQILCVTAL